MGTAHRSASKWSIVGLSSLIVTWSLGWFASAAIAATQDATSLNAAAQAGPVSQWTATPTTVTSTATGATTSAGNPPNALEALYARMGEGQIADLSGGVYARPSFKKSTRAPGVFVTLRGPPWSGAARVTLKAGASGSGDTLNLGADVGDLKLVRLDIQADDRSAILSVLHSAHRNVVIDNCRVYGPGDAYSANWNGDTKWLILGNEDADWFITKTKFSSVRREHVFYEHNAQGDIWIVDCEAIHAGRTFLQILARKFDGPVGVGDVTISGCRITDMCLEQGGGGSYVTCRGGMPTSTITLENTVMRGGCDAKLAYNRDSITGAVVVDEEPGSTKGSISVYPGGLKAFKIRGCDFEFGSVYRGKGSAIRPILRFVGPLENLDIYDTRCVVQRATGSAAVALEIGAGVKNVKIGGANTFVGRCVYRGVTYQSLDAMLAANPTLKG